VLAEAIEDLDLDLLRLRRVRMEGHVLQHVGVEDDRLQVVAHHVHVHMIGNEL
jgi:hypothetical protein